jgi:hypothetical protein
MCTRYLHYCAPSHTLFHLFSPPTGTIPLPRKDLFSPLLWFCKRKKMTVFAMQGVSLWHFHVCMYYARIGSATLL